MPSRNPVVELAVELVRRRSLTPCDAGCQELIAARLERVGFECETLRYGEVSNLWARRGRDAPLLVFAGHTDVVPTGPEQAWRHPPFAARVVDGMLHGRGAADMKGSLAAMVGAVEGFVDARPRHRGSIAFLVTSDEEGPSVDGTARVIAHLDAAGVSIDHCVVGEPTARDATGDTIKVGRRGSLSAAVRVIGEQGHVAYPHLASNPVSAAARLVAALDATAWDHGDALFPPTTFQVSNVNAGTGALNVIPGHLELSCNFRFGPASDAGSLKARFERLCEEHCDRYEIEWTLSALPFQTAAGRLLDAARDSIREVTGLDAECSTTGGTSDGRFIAASGAEVVEIGPCNRTIHKVDERVSIADLTALERIYRRLLERML